jgi:hypothetical protein
MIGMNACPLLSAAPLAFALTVAAALGGCNPISDVRLGSAEAAHWLQQTCGVQLVQPLQLVDGTLMTASGSQGWHTRVTVNLRIAAEEVPAIVRQLRLNAGMHQRGATDTHFSFESLARDHAERACEIDAPTGKFYFQYVD